MNKSEIRRVIRARKASVDDSIKAEAARAVFARVEELDVFQKADDILLYHSLPDELSTTEILDKWESSKNLFLPRVNGDDLEILAYDRTSLCQGAFHIAEPQGDELFSIDDVDMVIVPAVAYDRNCNRVGRGKGYYDRLLRDSRVFKVGVAYDFQLVDAIESEAHDVCVDMVVTERAVYMRRG